MRVYIASSLKNRHLNSELDAILQDAGFRTYLPQRDAKDMHYRPVDRARRIVQANKAGLLDADLVVAIDQGMGKDTAWECGFAHAKGKPVVLVTDERSTGNDYHVRQCAIVLTVPDFSSRSLRDLVPRLLGLEAAAAQ